MERAVDPYVERACGFKPLNRNYFQMSTFTTTIWRQINGVLEEFRKMRTNEAEDSAAVAAAKVAAQRETMSHLLVKEEEATKEEQQTRKEWAEAGGAEDDTWNSNYVEAEAHRAEQRELLLGLYSELMELEMKNEMKKVLLTALAKKNTRRCTAAAAAVAILAAAASFFAAAHFRRRFRRASHPRPRLERRDFTSAPGRHVSRPRPEEALSQSSIPGQGPGPFTHTTCEVT